MEQTEKKILINQLHELTMIVELQEKELQELKKRNSEFEKEKEELQRMKNEVQQDQRMIDRLLIEMGEDAGELLKKESDLKNLRKFIDQEKKKNNEQSEALRAWKKRLVEADESYMVRKRTQEIHNAIMFVLFLLMAADVCLVKDVKKLAGAVTAVWQLFYEIGKNIQIPIVGKVIWIIPFAVVIIVLGVFAFGVYRYLSRYADAVSMDVTYAAMYAAVLGATVLGWNSVAVFIVVETAYLIIRVKKDACDIYSPYSRY